VEIREASAEDLPGLAALPAADLPEEWTAWADEPHRTLVAVRAGQVVGAVNAAVVGPNEGWVEGLRVRGEDLALEDRLVAEAARLLGTYGVTLLRSAAPTDRVPGWVTRRMDEVCRFQVRVDGDPGPAAGVPPVPPEAAGAAAAVLESHLLRYARGLLPLGWRWRAFQAAMARAAARERRLLALDRQGAVLFLRRGPDRLVSAVTGSQTQALVAAVRSDPGARGRLACFLPQTSPEAEAFRGWPAHPWCPEGVAVYEGPVGA
jgi:hypothetical protein